MAYSQGHDHVKEIERVYAWFVTAVTRSNFGHIQRGAMLKLGKK